MQVSKPAIHIPTGPTPEARVKNQASSRPIPCTDSFVIKHHHGHQYPLHHAFLSTKLSDAHWLLKPIVIWLPRARTAKSGARADPQHHPLVAGDCPIVPPRGGQDRIITFPA